MRGKQATEGTETTRRRKRAPQGDIRQRASYTVEQQIAAVTALKKLGGLTYEGVASAREVIGANVSRATLHTWSVLHGPKVEQALGMMPPLLGDVVTDANRLDTDQVIDAAAGRDLSVMFGIFEERLRLRLGYSPDEHEALRILRQTAQRTGWDHIAAMRDLAKIMEVRPPIQVEPPIDNAQPDDQTD